MQRKRSHGWIVENFNNKTALLLLLRHCKCTLLLWLLANERFTQKLDRLKWIPEEKIVTFSVSQFALPKISRRWPLVGRCLDVILKGLWATTTVPWLCSPVCTTCRENGKLFLVTNNMQIGDRVVYNSFEWTTKGEHELKLEQLGQISRASVIRAGCPDDR